MNRAHWPTKENRQNFCIFSIFPAQAKNGQGWPQMGPGAVFFLLIWTLPTFWATRILILRVFIFEIFFDPEFPRFPNSRAGPHPFCCNISSATGINHLYEQGWGHFTKVGSSHLATLDTRVNLKQLIQKKPVGDPLSDLFGCV